MKVDPMAIGPSKYDADLAVALASIDLRLGAEGHVHGGCLIVFASPDSAGGFAVMGTADVVLKLPRALRETADKIEQDLQSLVSNAGINPKKEQTT